MKQRLRVALVVVLGGAAPASADVKQPIDLASELRGLAKSFPAPPATGFAPVAAPGCKALTSTERADIKKRVLAWIDVRHPDERGTTAPTGGVDLDLEISFGCKETSGSLVLDLSQDRVPAKPKPDTRGGVRRNYVLRVSQSAIDVIAESTTTMRTDWMEWADEGRISLLAQIDLDGDGSFDAVYSNHEHEGGATGSYDRIHVRYANGKLGDSGQVMNLVDVRLVANQLVVAGSTKSGIVFYACLDRDLHLARCAAAAGLQQAADRRAIIDRYSQMDASSLPDRELLAQELAILGIAGKRAVLLAAAQETSATDRAQRKVTAFLVKANLVEPAPMPDIISQTHAEARSFVDDLATKLGDTPCTTTPLSADDTARATAWLRKQDEKAASIVIEPSTCGPYMWVAWWPMSKGDGKRREVLLGRDGTTRIVGFTYEYEPMMDAMSHGALMHQDNWFTHGGTIVGVAIGGQNLWVIADSRIVAQTKGDNLAFYRYDDRWDETARDVFVDGGTLWHATPTGRERFDLALVRDHEARRAAIALLSQATPSSNAKYIAALQLLGADKALIAECKKLPLS